MHSDSLTRRSILKSLTIGAAAGSVLRVIPLQAAEYAHHLIDDEKTAAPAYAPKYFDAHQYKTLQALCETILPADADSGGVLKQIGVGIAPFAAAIDRKGAVAYVSNLGGRPPKPSGATS